VAAKAAARRDIRNYCLSSYEMEAAAGVPADCLGGMASVNLETGI
jgi:hypothetical protein